MDVRVVGWSRALACGLGVSALLAFAARLEAQASVSVALDDPAYRDVNLVVGAGLVDTIVTGQRPYSRREFARIIAEALRNAKRLGTERVPAVALDALDALVEQFRDELQPSLNHSSRRQPTLDRMAISMTSTNSAPRLVPPDTGIGGVNATIDPLAEGGQHGRDVMLGNTLFIDAVVTVPIMSQIALLANPQLRQSNDSSFTSERTLSMQTLAARYQSSNFVLSIGRDYLGWGLGREGGLFFSDNARPLDMIWAGSDLPWILPGFLRFLGPSKASLFIADLGARQFFPHTYLAGYKLSALPSKDLEFGLSVFDFNGGTGAPPATFGKRVENLFLFPFLRLNGFQFSNLQAGIEIKYRLRGLNGAQLYWELNLDDFDPRRLASVGWTDDAAHVFGLDVPRLDRDGRWSLAAEFHHTGTRFARHQQFLSGPTEDQFLLGDPLGPDADAGYLFLDWTPSRITTMSLEIAEESYRANQYIIWLEEPFIIASIGERPQEHRMRATLSFERSTSVYGLSWRAGAGIEHVTNFDFTAFASRTEALASLSVSYAFRHGP